MSEVWAPRSTSILTVGAETDMRGRSDRNSPLPGGFGLRCRAELVFRRNDCLNRVGMERW